MILYIYYRLLVHATTIITCPYVHALFSCPITHLYMFFLSVRCGSHRGGSLQNVLGNEWTCGTTLASAYVLCCLSAAWSQLQMKERSPSGSEC